MSTMRSHPFGERMTDMRATAASLRDEATREGLLVQAMFAPIKFYRDDCTFACIL